MDRLHTGARQVDHKDLKARKAFRVPKASRDHKAHKALKAHKVEMAALAAHHSIMNGQMKPITLYLQMVRFTLITQTLSLQIHFQFQS
jgi:hypothetical protein